jgi:hypothetical protein
MRFSQTISGAPALDFESGRSRKSGAVVTRVLLVLGLLYPLFYVVINDVVAAARYRDYSRLSQAISELSGTSAPTRHLLTATIPAAMGLLICFGVGVWRSAHGGASLRAAGGLLVAHATTFPLWALSPMTSREEMLGPIAPNDVGHLLLTALTLMFILLQTGFAATALGGRFRMYSRVTAIAVVVMGGLTALQSVQLPRGPTPWLGLFERASVGAWLLWLAVLALVLLRKEGRIETHRGEHGQS